MDKQINQEACSVTGARQVVEEMRMEEGIALSLGEVRIADLIR